MIWIEGACRKIILRSAYLIYHHCGVPHSSQLHRDEWDIRANARTVLLSRHHGIVISTGATVLLSRTGEACISAHSHQSQPWACTQMQVSPPRYAPVEITKLWEVANLNSWLRRRERQMFSSQCLHIDVESRAETQPGVFQFERPVSRTVVG